MFPDSVDDINNYPNAQYGVKLVFDRMVIFTSIELPRIAEEEEAEDEDALTERAINQATLNLADHYGINFAEFGVQEAEITCEAVSR
jgi:hypothetical protein